MLSLIALLPTDPPVAFIDGLGGAEMLLIFAIVLLLFGGDKLPEFARGLGKTMRELKKAASGVEDEFRRAMEEDERKKFAAQQNAATANPPSTSPAQITGGGSEYDGAAGYPAEGGVDSPPVSDTAATAPAAPAETSSGTASATPASGSEAAPAAGAPTPEASKSTPAAPLPPPPPAQEDYP
jgi:sec-independent protein translocase protein TatA